MNQVAFGLGSRPFRVLVLAGLCLPFPWHTSAHAQTVAPFLPAKLAEIDAAITNAISQNKLPGGVLWLERQGRIYHRAYGHRALLPHVETMTEDTIFDAASLTKVIATTPCVMLLVERGQVKLEEPVRTYLPEFRGEGTDKITVRHLMTHTSGLRPDLSLNPPWNGLETGLKLAMLETPKKPPGSSFRYSDINFILLGELVRRVSGSPLNEFAAREIYAPLRMNDTGFLPSEQLLGRIAPTTKTADGVVRGVVHDPTSRRMGGVAGHAGLFTTAADLARFARMMLNLGELDGTRIFKPETVRLMTSVQSPPSVPERRGLGWDIDSPYARARGDLFPIGSYGHTGWTGTSIWIDPFSQTFLIFLSNRNHPTEEGTVVALRKVLGTLAAEAEPDFDFAHVPGALPAMEKAEPARRGKRKRLPPSRRRCSTASTYWSKRDSLPSKN
jgi:CubicO group peptidase (beta-lactamase class C family)